MTLRERNMEQDTFIKEYGMTFRAPNGDKVGPIEAPLSAGYCGHRKTKQSVRESKTKKVGREMRVVDKPVAIQLHDEYLLEDVDDGAWNWKRAGCRLFAVRFRRDENNLHPARPVPIKHHCSPSDSFVAFVRLMGNWPSVYTDISHPKPFLVLSQTYPFL